MSDHNKSARPVRARGGLRVKLPYPTTPQRTVFSAASVLIGTGAVTLAFIAPEAKAKSALDEMAWMPQQLPLTQGTASANAMAGVAALARAVAPEPAQKPMASGAPLPVAAVASAGSRVAVSLPQPVPGALAPQSPVSDANAPRQVQARGFADLGLAGATMPVDAVVADPVPAPVEAPRWTRPDSPRMGVASSPIRMSESAPAPASSTANRAPNLQADLQSLRGSLATGAAAVVDDEMTVVPSKRAAPSVHQAGSGQVVPDGQSTISATGSTSGARRAPRNARPADEYSDWLGQGAGTRNFGDQAVVPEQAVRAALRNAAEAAAARSPTIKQARNDWEAAKFDVDQVKGQRYPQVQLNGNSPSITGDSASFNQYNRPTASIAVTTMIYDWGKTSKSISSRQKTADAAEFYYQSVSQQNAYDVSSNLIELAKNRQIYIVGESYVKRMSQLVAMLAEIVKVDQGRMSELTEAKSRLLQAQTSQEIVAAQVRSLQLTVNKLVGNEPTPMPAGTQWQFQLDSLDNAVAAIATNPQIQELTAEAESAKLNAKSVRADGLPKLNWVINKNTASDVFGNRQPWSTMLQLSWTPFQGGSQRAAERAALARADSSSDKRDQLQLDSEYKVRDAHRDAIALSTRAKLYAGLVVDTDLIRKQYFEQWYHLNRRTLLDVLSAESEFYNNQVNATTAQFDAYQAVLKIHLNNGTIDTWLKGD